MCICTIYTLYSTIEYDIIIGKITHIYGDNCNLNIGDQVFMFLDYYNFYICREDPLMSVCVDDYYLFKIPNKLNTPLILPFLKYGSISYLLRILTEKNKEIIIYSPYNIYNIIQKLSKNTKLEWKNLNEINYNGDNYVAILNDKWIFKINNKKYIFDFKEETLIHMFGKKNINILLQLYFKEHSLNTGVYYNLFNNIENKCLCNKLIISKSRFFNIYTFS